MLFVWSGAQANCQIVFIWAYMQKKAAPGNSKKGKKSFSFFPAFYCCSATAWSFNNLKIHIKKEQVQMLFVWTGVQAHLPIVFFIGQICS